MTAGVTPRVPRPARERASAVVPAGATDRLPGGAMLQPAMIVAVAVLAVNDHWLKGRFGADPAAGVVTGKLSDIAGLAFFPALVVSVAEVVRWAVHRGGDGWLCTRRELTVAVVVTAAGFAAVQSVPAAAAGYEAGLAALRWCPAAVAAVLTGGPSPSLPTVHHVMDVTDVLCVPAVWAGGRAVCRVGLRAPRCVTATRRTAADER